MKFLDGSAWILQTDDYRIADRIYHNRPMESGREIINRLANVHVRSNTTSPRDWRRIVNDATNYRRDGRNQERSNRQ